MKAARKIVVLFGRAIPDANKLHSHPRWASFFKNLEKSNFWSNQGPKAVFVDFKLNFTSIGVLLSTKRESRILVQVEPVSVNPFQYTKVVARLFSVIIAERCNSASSISSNSWTAGFDFEEKIDNQKNVQVGLLIGNKHSFVEGSQYHLRRMYFDTIDKAGFDIRVAGRDWDLANWKIQIKKVIELSRAILSLRNLRKNWLKDFWGDPWKPPCIGSPESSSQFWSRVSVALIIENEGNQISEKIFEALSQGCAVLYIGTKLPPISSILQMEERTSSEEIAKFIQRFPNGNPDIDDSKVVLRSVVPDSETGFRELVRMIESS
jgi:hypothetical protein